MDFLGAEPPVNDTPVDEPSSRMEGDVVVANPMIKVEIDYNVLGLDKSKLILNTPRQSLMRSEIDSWKKSLVDHVFFDHDGFRILKRHFQMSLWVNHLREWVLVDYDSSVEECLNRHQISRKNDQYWFRVNLNEGKTAGNCGWP